MSSPIFTVNLPYKVRCNLPDCGKPSNKVFKQNLDDTMVTCCSPYHSRLAEERWNEKKDKNIKPGVPLPPSEMIAEGDNIEQLID